MKKLNRRILEAQLRNMENQPTAEDMARMAEGEQLAYAEYLRRQAAEAQDAAAKRQKKKSRRLRTVVVCALAAAFLGLPLLYTMLMPVTVSNANSFMRQATIWINDTLHLNIKIEEPVQGDGRVYDTETVEMTFPSVADAEA
ncbi:MAG: hypothetical protein IJ507_02665, partial [Clostridia bacterium]|nr:hypothetical protein [Clostridia bacterium]